MAHIFLQNSYNLTPGINNWDAAVYKNLRLREPLRLQVRGEIL
jgi:hypothetical protein